MHADDIEVIRDGRIEVMVPPTKERLAHATVEQVVTARGGRETRAYDDPLLFYHRRGSLTGRQFDAGSKLYALWYYGCLNGRHAVSKYGEVRSSAATDSAPILNARYNAAMLAVGGVARRRAVYAVVCQGEFVYAAAVHAEGKDVKRRTAQRRGMELLRDGLDDLVTHFGL